MYLFDSWKRSLEFFGRKNLSIFGLVTLKAIQTTYSQIFRYLWLPIFFVLSVDIALLYGKLSFMRFQSWHMIFWALRIVFLIFVYLTVRSSVLRKDWYYYRSYWKHALYLFAMLALVFGMLNWLGYWWWAFLTCFITFTILFFLDSDSEVIDLLKSGMRAIKMVIYNAPVYLIISASLLVAWWFYMVAVQAIVYYIRVPIADASFLFIPAEACVLANLYIKWFHEQFDLYFDQPK